MEEEFDEETTEIEVPENLKEQVRAVLDEHDDLRWDDAIQIVLDETQLDRVRAEKQKAKKKSGDFTEGSTTAGPRRDRHRPSLSRRQAERARGLHRESRGQGAALAAASSTCTKPSTRCRPPPCAMASSATLGQDRVQQILRDAFHAVRGGQ